MNKVKIIVISAFIVAIIAINFLITGNNINNNTITVVSLKQAFADLSECDIIITPEGGGTEGAYLAEFICEVYPLKVETECLWTGICAEICMFDDEQECHEP